MKGTEVKGESDEMEEARRVLEQVLGSPKNAEQLKPGRKPRKKARVGPLFNGTIHIEQLVLKVG